MGYLEGYASCKEIKDFYPNFSSDMFNNEGPGSKTIAFLQENYQWMKRQADLNAETDDYWYAVKAALNQIEGLYEGYVAGCGSSSTPSASASSHPYATLDKPTLEHFLLINAWGDLYQIALKFWEPGRNSRMRGSKTRADAKARLIERCSAIVKLLPGNSDVVFGHATWDTYESLFPRIIKHYSYPLVRANKVTSQGYDVYFSSSPALMSSVDDFYTSSGFAKLGVIETTNSLFNVKLLDQIVPSSNLCWMRALLSNQLATSGYNWAQQFSRYHSGTYTNQWMSLDLTKFQPGQLPESGFLTVYEEVPGLDHYEDQTQFLINNAYWPSYNVPFYPDIFQASGYAKVCQFDKNNCYDTAPRAMIFKQYKDQVTDLKGGMWILSYNSWQNDTASQYDSCNAIACRGDLEPDAASVGAFGALDAKVALASDVKRNAGQRPTFYARLGPTSDQQPVFCWSSFAESSSYSHNAHPDCFNFTWQQFPPSTAGN